MCSKCVFRTGYFRFAGTGQTSTRYKVYFAVVPTGPVVTVVSELPRLVMYCVSLLSFVATMRDVVDGGTAAPPQRLVYINHGYLRPPHHTELYDSHDDNGNCERFARVNLQSIDITSHCENTGGMNELS
ncbi:hypothetical protein J6590_058812 [Homalodisca vitripennis]|nr:hypothetical protein J6590_058812 [Homalodisca vitripennis]